MGCYGDDYADTPNLDRLAKQGCRYTNDLGGIPEDELIERMWPGRKQPLTATPTAEITPSAYGKMTVAITCATEDASIGYRIGGLYHRQLRDTRQNRIKLKWISAKKTKNNRESQKSLIKSRPKPDFIS